MVIDLAADSAGWQFRLGSAGWIRFLPPAAGQWEQACKPWVGSPRFPGLSWNCVPHADAPAAYPRPVHMEVAGSQENEQKSCLCVEQKCLSCLSHSIGSGKSQDQFRFTRENRFYLFLGRSPKSAPQGREVGKRALCAVFCHLQIRLNNLLTILYWMLSCWVASGITQVGFSIHFCNSLYKSLCASVYKSAECGY